MKSSRNLDGSILTKKIYLILSEIVAQKDAQLVHLEMTDSKKTELVDKVLIDFLIVAFSLHFFSPCNKFSFL